MRFSFTAAAIAAFLSAGAAQAAVIVNVQEDGADVVIYYSGTLDLTGATFVGTEPSDVSGAIPSDGIIINLLTSYDVYSFTGVGGTPHGAGAGEAANGATGVVFGFDAGAVRVPVGYDGSTALNGAMIFLGASLSSLGYTPGVYGLGLPNDAIFTYVGVTSAVPLPATAPLLLGALALTGFAAHRRNS
jgi:hypothetical protein